MLKDILAAEKKAHEWALEAEKYKAEAAAEAEKEKKHILEERLLDAEKEVERLRTEHKQSVASSMQSAEDESRAAIENMRALEKEKKAQWTDEIFARVLRDES